MLDENRGEDLWYLCGALADFLKPFVFQADKVCTPLQPIQLDFDVVAEQDAAPVRQRLCVFDLLEPVGERERTVNSLYRFVKIPDGWLLPAALLRPWEKFTLIRDVSCWTRSGPERGLSARQQSPLAPRPAVVQSQQKRSR